MNPCKGSLPTSDGAKVHTLDTVEAFDTAIEDVNTQIVLMFQHLASLQSGRNALMPAFRIPAELLSRCFVLAVGPFVGTTYGALQLLNITHVCRHWREVALADLSLWSRIDWTYPPLAHAMLLRAGKSPLSMTFPLGMDEVYDEALGAIVERCSQIESLNITASCSSLVEQFQPIISGSAVCLRYLLYDGTTTPIQNQIPDSDIPLYSLATPHLRELHLVNFWPQYALQQASYPNLTRLSISSTCASVDHAPPPSLFDLLARLPRLEDLAIHQSYSWIALILSDTESSNTILDMQTLRRLSIFEVDDSPKGPSLIQAICAPHLEHVVVAWANCGEQLTSRLLTEWWGSWSKRQLCSLDLTMRQSHGPGFTLSQADCRWAIKLEYTLRGGGRTQQVQDKAASESDALRRACDSRSVHTYPVSLCLGTRAAKTMVPSTLLATATSLQLTVGNDSAPAAESVLYDTASRAWAEDLHVAWSTLATSHWLTRLTVDPNTCWSLLYICRHRLPFIATAAPFPALRVFELINADFRPENRFSRDHAIYGMQNRFACILEPLTDWMAHRKHCGVPVETLIIRYCQWNSNPPPEDSGLAQTVGTLLLDP